MTFEDFEIKFEELKKEFLSAKGKEPVTLIEFEHYLFERKYNRKKQRKNLRSLKGLNF